MLHMHKQTSKTKSNNSKPVLHSYIHTHTQFTQKTANTPSKKLYKQIFVP